MATSTIKMPGSVSSGSSAVITTHTIDDARAVRIGKMYIANVTITLTSNVSAWTRIFTLTNINIPVSQYVFGYNGSAGDLFYIGGGSYSGEVSCISSLTSGTQIKICIPLALN